jgi:glycosyltransferase involved in cell wall biosynthesis
MLEAKKLPKVALFMPSLSGGGAERVMLNLAAGFASCECDVDLVLASASGAYIDQVDPRVTVVDLGARRVAASLPRLIRYLRRERPAAMLVTHVHANVIALVAKSLSGVDVRLVVRDTESPVEAARRRRTTWNSLIAILARRYYRYADAVVSVCLALREQIATARSISSQKISVIYNPVRVDALTALAAMPAGHAWLDNSDIRTILAIGRLDEQKDFESLIRAFCILRRDMDVKLVILGEGSRRSVLQKLIGTLGLENDVDLPGFAPNPYAFLGKADLFALSSLWEGLPNVLIEALALGTPIVSTDCETGPREILRNGRDGKLVPVADPAAMAVAMREALQNQTRRMPAAESLRRFEFLPVVHQYLDLLLPQERLASINR